MSDEQATPWTRVWQCGVLLAVAAGIALAVIPNLVERRGTPNSVRALRSLNSLSRSQVEFREGDKEGDQNLDYGTLRELSDAGLIDGYLGSGTRLGYLFQATYSQTTPEFLWFAVANPTLPTTTGDHYYCTNQEGVIFYTTERAFQLNDRDCTIPAWSLPVGQ